MIKNAILLIAIAFLLEGCSSGYEIRGDAVYFTGWNPNGHYEDPVNADPETFQKLAHRAYGKDARHVFFEGRVVPGADAASFESIDTWYGRDKNHGFYCTSIVKGSRGLSFRRMMDDFSTDGRDVFFDSLPLHVCSVRNFRYVYPDESPKSYAWTTDGCSYYHMHFRLPAPDYKKVRLFKNSAGLAKDHRYAYFMDRRADFNDSGRRITDTIDAATFTVENFIECRDKWGCINVFHGREPCRQEGVPTDSLPE